MKILVSNIGMLATPCGERAKGGQQQGQIQILEKAWLLLEDDKIISVGDCTVPTPSAELTINAKNKLVTPGLVDAHTHLVFGGWREKELLPKLHKVPYLEILAQGGGILSTVRATRRAEKEQLKAKTKKILNRMLKQGVTTIEAKSGYGLDVTTELKLLEIIKELQEEEVVSIVPTFLGAHALPPEYQNNREDYLKLVTENVLPQVVQKKLAAYIDAFCEQGVFTVAECRQILQAGKKAGLGLKCHCDEIVALGGTEMAAELGAVSCEHLIKANAKGIAALQEKGTIACLLPGTSFYLDATYAPAQEMIKQGVPIAFGSDFNPGSCPCNSLQLAMHIGCYKYGMTPEECLTAVTLNSAAAIGKAQTIGTLEQGKMGDLVIWDAPNLNYLFYRFGDNLAATVIKQGSIVVTNYC